MIQEPQNSESNEIEEEEPGPSEANLAESSSVSDKASEAQPVPAIDTEENPSEGSVEDSALVLEPEPASEPKTEDGDEVEDDSNQEAEDLSFSDPDKKWYVVHTYSGYEAKVKAALEERLQTSPLGEMFGKVLVPAEDVVEMRGGRRRVSSRKYFPGYILIQMKMSTDTWYLIKNTPKVTGFLGGSNDPTPLKDSEVQKILGQMRGEQEVRPRVEFEEGQNVRVIDGPFANFSGVVDDVNHERGKVRIMVTIFGRPTPVELEFLQVEKV